MTPTAPSPTEILIVKEQEFEKRRKQALGKTQKMVVMESNKPYSSFSEVKHLLCLYTASPKETTLGKNILQVPCRTNFDEKWYPIHTPQTTFLVHHMGAPNLEILQTEFDETDCFDEKAYVQNAAEIFQNGLYAQWKSGAEHAVWGNLSLEAFLRSPEEIDSEYTDPNIETKFQTKIAEAFFAAIATQPNLQMHLCLANDGIVQKETFTTVYKKYPSLHNRISIYCKTDAIQIAQNLANKTRSYKVSLANTTHAKFIGRDWLSSEENSYTDELHGRSTMLSYFDSHFEPKRLANAPTQTMRRFGNGIIPIPKTVKS